MAASTGLPDYYAVLQVHPDADDEVIAAAYRQLMKKYHPDLAGDDPSRAAEHATRAKAINEAFSVLRDRERRRHYDSARIFFGTYQPRTAPQTPPAPPREPASPPPQPTEDARSHRSESASPNPSSPAADLLEQPSASRPLGLVAAVYYLLPGAYEWEQGQTKELITVVLLPVVITFGFALLTGRLDTWIGTTFLARLAGAAVLLLLSIPLLSSLPRVALAAGPTAFLLTGLAAPALRTAHLPLWLALLFAALVSLAFSARLYIFSVLPALAVCYALSVATHSM